MKAWEKFVLAHGWHARSHHLAAVVERTVDEVERVRRTGACTRLVKHKGFAELFALWNGRPPGDDEWPRPRQSGGGAYEWQAPEDALLASLVGRLGVREVSNVLTKRLRERTGDCRAKRDRNSIWVRLQRIGMQTRDIVGGITASAAGREIGSYTPVWQAIRAKRLPAFRVGPLLVIPHAAWASFKAARVFPPPGYIQLSTLKRPLGIRSDKLSEWARMGYVPTAIRCNPCGTKARSTQFGTWFISPQMAKKLVADRRAGRPMPWWGKPEPSNLSITYGLWKKRQHPEACKTCAGIWGTKGAPLTFREYSERYPPIAHGAKRHLTMIWSPGMTVQQVARFVGRSVSYVGRAIENGNLEVTRISGRRYISRTEAVRWKYRRFPNGASDRSWVSLAEARRLYLFTLGELRVFIARKQIKSKVGTNGPMRGITYVPRHQCGMLRERIGFTEGEAARRAGISVYRLRLLLRGVDWRGAKQIPLVTLQAVIRRLNSQDTGCTITEAATKLDKTPEWIQQQILNGTIRIARAKFDRRRLYISAPMLERLKQAKRNQARSERLNKDWLHVSDAALEAGVSIGTIDKWARLRELSRRRSITGWRYHRKAIRARARDYWKSCRFRRATPPGWLQDEQQRRSEDEGTTAIHGRAPWRRRKARLAPRIRRKRKAGAKSVEPRAAPDAPGRCQVARRHRRHPAGVLAATRAERRAATDPVLHRLWV